MSLQSDMLTGVNASIFVATLMMQGYVPLNKDRRQATLERKRQEYRECVAQYFGGPDNSSGPTPLDMAVFHQVRGTADIWERLPVLADRSAALCKHWGHGAVRFASMCRGQTLTSRSSSTRLSIACGTVAGQRGAMVLRA